MGKKAETALHSGLEDLPSTPALCFTQHVTLPSPFTSVTSSASFAKCCGGSNKVVMWRATCAKTSLVVKHNTKISFL